MKVAKLLGAVGALVLLACTPVRADGSSWTGLYLGAHAGYGWGDHDVTPIHPCPTCGNIIANGGAFTGSASASADGWHGGVQIGANYQVGSLVLGIEADISGADFSSSQTIRMDYDTDWVSAVNLDMFGTARVRLGYSTGQFLIYATGGLAWARGEMDLDSISITGPVHMASMSGDAYHVGWTLGGGFEYALGSNFSLKAEYLYVDLGKADYDPKGAITPDHGGLPAGTPWHELSSTEIDFHTVRIGVNYRFGG
jgi:Opacity protein and related surface antigens